MISDLLQSKIDRAIKLLRDNEPQDGKGYGLAFSGGKDSIVIKQLAIEAGSNFKAFYSQTTIDPPELVKYIREHHKDVEWLRNPKGGFFKRLIEKGCYPSRFIRWCCREFKEQAIVGFVAKIVGVRAAESARRAKLWKSKVEDFTNKDGIIICPIVDWTDQDVWDFIRSRKLAYCELYDQGFTRLGCINCPMTSKSKREMELNRWPQFKSAWIAASEKMWERHRNRITRTGALHIASRFHNGKEWFYYQMSKMSYAEWKQETCQMELMFTGAQEEEDKK